MDCRKIEELLSEYIDGVLPEDVAGRVEAHLADCAGCSDAYEEMSRLVGYMRDMETVDEPADLLVNVKARMDQPSPLTGWLRRVFWPPLVRVPAAAAVLAALAIFLVYRPGMEGAPDVYEFTLRVDAVEEGDELGAGRVAKNMATEVEEEEPARPARDEDKPASPTALADELKAQPATTPEAVRSQEKASPVVLPEEKREATSKEKRSRAVEQEPVARSIMEDTAAEEVPDVGKTGEAKKAAPKKSISLDEVILTAGKDHALVSAVQMESMVARPDTTWVEIPADSLDRFLEKLRGRGRVVSVIPPEARTHRGILRIAVIYASPSAGPPPAVVKPDTAK
jgi:hypothetical protein